MDISQSLSTLAMTMGPSDQRALSSQLSEFSRRLESAVQIDWQTGATDFRPDEVRAAAEDLQSATSFAVGASFADTVVASLESGFAVLDPVGQDAVPWRALNDPFVVNRLSPVRLQALGISSAEPDVVRAELSARFRSAPSRLDPAAVDGLVAALRDKRILGAAVENQSRLTNLLPARDANAMSSAVVAGLRRDDSGDGDGDGGGGGGAGGGGGVGPVLLDIAKAVPDFVAQCLPTISATQPSATVGFGLCFDEPCARKLAAILQAGGAPALATAVTAAAGAASAGISAAVAAAVAAAGGWVTLIVVICVIIFSGWFSSCITGDGACIHFPWWAGFGPVPFARRLS